MNALELTHADGGSILKVRAKTRADRNEVRQVRGDALLVAVTDPPEKGKANKAIIRTLAEHLNVAKRQLTIVTGETGRDKRIHIAGLSPASIRGRLGPSHDST